MSLLHQITKDTKTRGDQGSCWRGRVGKYEGCCSNPFTGKTEYLGFFDRKSDAHEAWVKRRKELAEELIEKFSLSYEISLGLREFYEYKTSL